MVRYVIITSLLLLSTPVWACGSFEECIEYAETGLSCHSWVREGEPIVYKYSSKCPPNSGGIDDSIGCTCGELTQNMIENFRVKAIAYKLDEISKKLEPKYQIKTCGETVDGVTRDKPCIEADNGR